MGESEQSEGGSFSIERRCKLKATRTTAWDETWELTATVHLLGIGVEPSEKCKHLRLAMSELQKMNLPIRAISAIGYAVKYAWECGKDGSRKS